MLAALAFWLHDLADEIEDEVLSDPDRLAADARSLSYMVGDLRLAVVALLRGIAGGDPA